MATSKPISERTFFYGDSMTVLRILIALTIILSAQLSFSHSGRTNAYGCHTNHSTGDYHCHNPKRVETNKSSYRTPSSFEESKSSYSQSCCKTCKKGKACGDTCISKLEQCHKGVGCACDG